MTVVSFSFLVFFALLMLLYFVFPHKIQWFVLLIFSYVFYYSVSGRLPIYIFITTVITYLAANFINKIKKDTDKKISENESITKDEKKVLRSSSDKKRKAVLIIAICLNIGLLAIFKYVNPFLQAFSKFSADFGVAVSATKINLILPLGISFYTFQSIGYLVDVYRKKTAPEKNFFKTALFVSYFSQIIEGPIGRFDKLAPQLFAQHKFSFERFKKSVFLVLWGFFKKLVIADNLAPMITDVKLNYNAYDGFQVLLTMFLFGIQLYADFSGYMDIVTGFSSILGIEIEKNFNRPYFSKTVTEFWRKWHISLCSWFRDYLFYPIFMSKKMMNLAKRLRTKGHKTAAKNIPTYIAMIVVWFLTGLWHAANWPQVLWGLCNGLIMISALQFKPAYDKINKKLHIKTNSFPWTVFRIIRTYLLMTLLNFISEFATLRDALNCIARMFSGIIPSSVSVSYFFPKIIDSGIFVVAFTLLACLLLFAHSLYEEKHGSVIKKVCSKNFVIQLTVFIVILFYIVLFSDASNNAAGGFMYAQF